MRYLSKHVHHASDNHGVKYRPMGVLTRLATAFNTLFVKLLGTTPNLR